MLKISAKMIGKEIVQAKLLKAAPNILLQNRVMMTAMLKEIKSITEAQTPIGPGHFGYHLRQSYVIDVTTRGFKTIGVLKSPAQGYWREYGTRGGFSKSAAMSGYLAALGGDGGEKALFVAHRAAGGVRKFIRFYYNGMANWWRL